jgi:uncharacterized Zn finger protein
MKVNILYVFWIAALLGFIYIARHLQEESGQQLFGTAETEGQVLRLDYPVFIQKNYVKTGDKVKKGDTLMVLISTELDKSTSQKIAEIGQLETERNAKNTAIEKDIEVFNARQATRVSDLQSQIKVLQSEISVQNNLKEAIGNGSYNADNNIKLQNIKTLEEAIRQVDLQNKEQLKLFDSQRISNNNICASKAQQMQKELGFIGKEKTKLLLFSPCDGFIEQVFALEKEVVPNYKDLLKINPQQPNKVIGFIHESLNIPYRLGDTVLLSSSLRPSVSCKAQLVGVSPKLVELPFRLRKYAEIKAWGREVYINLPSNNDFFIGEKIIIKLKTFE